MASRRSTLSHNQKLTLLIAFLAILITSIVTCISAFISSHDWFSPTSASTVEYAGRVVDSSSQQPIAGAKVSLELGEIPSIAYTDSEGVFLFRVVSDLDISGQIRVEVQGYPIYTRNVHLSQGSRSFDDIRLTTMAASLLTATVTPENSLTETPTPTAISTLQEPNYSCADLRHVRLKVGDSAHVVYVKVNLRSYPGVPDIWDQNIVRTLAEGTSLTIIGGPECAHEGTWWEVNTENGYTGWIREFLNSFGAVIEP